MLNRPRLRRLLSTASSTATSVTTSIASGSSSQSAALWRGERNIDASQCKDPLVRESDLCVAEDVITEDEERVVADECAAILRRRRYEDGHWDHVIVKFKEMERSRWSTGAVSRVHCHGQLGRNTRI